MLALLLGGGKLLQLAGITTAFTLGHSITLAIAALDLVRPPPSLIEPLIALTIVAAAVEAFWGKLLRHRWKIAATFGLIHGFAFASALSDLELAGDQIAEALFGYNLGVELGQLLFVLLFSIPIILLQRITRSRAARRARHGGGDLRLRHLLVHPAIFRLNGTKHESKRAPTPITLGR